MPSFGSFLPRLNFPCGFSTCGPRVAQGDREWSFSSDCREVSALTFGDPLSPPSLTWVSAGLLLLHGPFSPGCSCEVLWGYSCS